MRSSPWFRTPRSRRSTVLTSVITSVTALAVTAGLAIQPGLTDLGRGAEAASNSYAWNEDTSAEQLRQDQCLMADVLRLGGSSMAQSAQDGLNQPADKLHTLADRQYWQKTPLATAYQADRDGAAKQLDAMAAKQKEWKGPLSGLSAPAGFASVADFSDPPGTAGDGRQSFYDQTGLSRWIADRFWKAESDFYQDSTPTADAKTLQAIDAVGLPRYGTDPTSGGLSGEEWNRALAERSAFQWLRGDWLDKAGSDDARIFLASGGFPRTAPQPGTAEYRIAVEDLKSRFASCAWRDPLDPDKVLGGITDTAASEWQQEVAAQAVQRNQILSASADATKALATGAKALGELLGDSWVADHIARWQDYWSPGGAGWVGDAPAVIEVHDAQGKCLDVEGGRTDNGTPVQLYTCNGTAAQQWRIYGDGRGSHLQSVDSLKCLDAAGGKTDDGTKIQIYQCNGTAAQGWEFNLRATTPLKNVGAGKCLDLHTFNNGNDAWLWPCNGTGAQKFDVKPTGHNGTVPPDTQFTQARNGINGAQSGAKQQLEILRAQLATAQKAAAASDTAEQTAYTSADAAGAPRGRGLLVGQQKNQVTQATLAALQAMVNAGVTAEAATRASGADSQTIAQRALAQAAQVQTEFRKKAAETAEWQAKAAADAAKIHRDNAKKDKETAEAKLADTLKAEGDAKAAAADAHAKRLAAEAEAATAKTEKDTAVVKQGEAAQHKQNAQTEAANAKTAKDKAEASEATAVEKKNAAVKARDNAKAKRDDAWDAQQKADAARAKADALAAYAQARESEADAKESRAAANEAAKHADEAEAAASKARSEADAASAAAAEADAAATRAEAAAKRARSDADAAQAAKAKADAAVKTATSAEADALAASQHAASEANTAVKLADEAEAKAKTAKTQADEASKEAAKAVEASAKAAGYAHVTAQAAEDAGNAAVQVAKPANDAIQLGSPYITTDSAAGLVVLAGQASKTIAEQQKAVADAHSQNAQNAAATAQALADQAQADTKEAYQHAANAARYAADARGYATEALGYAAAAATAASKAADSLARTIEYDRQATEDAAAANTAAGQAEGYAKDARTAADQAALDADAAHVAAAQATQDAKDARAAADRADIAATQAEQASKDADKLAKDAQTAADQGATKEKNKQITTGAGSIGGVFYKSRFEPVGDPEILKKDNCNILAHTGDCVLTAKVTGKVFVDLYLCTNPDIPDAQAGCLASDTLYLTTQELKKPETQEITHVITPQAFNDAVSKGFVKALTEDFVGCWDKITGGGGSWGNCGWAAFDITTLVLGSAAINAIADGVKSLDAAVRFGIGVGDAWKGLRAAGLTDAAITGIGAKLFDRFVKACGTGARAMLSARMPAAKGSCPLELIGYNSDELSHLAFEYRVENGFYGADHNVAVARVPGWNDPKTGDLVVASSGWSGHSETEILDILKAKGVDPKKITAMYTERQPCKDCDDALAKALGPDVTVTYSVPYALEYAPASKQLLAQYISQAKGGRMARSTARGQGAEVQKQDAPEPLM
ncbi:hypothetical protein GCM10010289_75930 [Streptomyces violascens]|uniref:Ricin B lectin domain-containing protein n=2 Tax=Streptomyces violascens TaxID=67381 RepID=A0ABQ3QV53_9ACTN|nr:hypothetical protein GCM10010289_75930 [Streptomyces violascens]GHI41160.1 hypothetical protein Sviol_55680 [Streptomyces violascens]